MLKSASSDPAVYSLTPWLLRSVPGIMTWRTLRSKPSGDEVGLPMSRPSSSVIDDPVSGSAKHCVVAIESLSSTCRVGHVPDSACSVRVWSTLLSHTS